MGNGGEPRGPARSETRTEGVRWGCLAAAFVAVLLIGGGLGLFAFWLIPSWMRPDTRWAGPPTEPEPMRMAPPEPSGAVPLGGGDALDRYGYPLKSADAVALRSLLLAGRFAELERHVEHFQTEAESDFRREYWIFDAMRTFDTADPQVGRRIEAWLQQSPTSFAPHLAKAEHLSAVAGHQRGGAVVAETNEQRLAVMHTTFTRAMASYGRALELRPRLFVADIGLIVAASFVGDDETKARAFAHAVSVCPSCASPRKVLIHYSRPRWGGSLGAMMALGADAHEHAAANPRLSALRGFVEWERGETHREREEWGPAIAAYDRALAFGELEDFYRSRADVRTRSGDTEGAVADFERARALRPAAIASETEILAYLRARRGEQGVGAFVRALLLDPTDRSLHPRVRDASMAAAFVGWQHFRAERMGDALAWLDLARQIDPSNGDARNRVAFAARQHGARCASVMARTEERARNEPDSFEAIRDLEWAMLASGINDQRVPALWDGFLRRHPRESRAFVERGGTLASSGNVDGAVRDAITACNLGNRVGCQLAEEWRARQAAHSR